MRDFLQIVDYDKDQLAYALANAIKERDEAREALREWQPLRLWGAEPQHIHDFIKGQQTRIHESQDIEKTCEQLERERDEAREATAKWESSFDAMERAGAEQARRADENREWALRAERERDEARELCRELSDLVAYGLGQHGSFWSLAAMRQATTAIQKVKALEAAK